MSGRAAFGVLLLLLPSLAPAAFQVDILSRRDESYRPSTGDCARRGDCSLREFRFKLVRERILLPGDIVTFASYATDIRVVQTTERVDQIEEYALVQYIRGCRFESTWDGRETRKQLFGRAYFGTDVDYRHKDWEVDSDDGSPLYTSYDASRPFGLWRWHDDPGNIEPKRSTMLFEKPAPHPTVFISDMHDTAGRHPVDRANGVQLARNTSLEFRTCLFKRADVPAATDHAGSNIDRSKALHCFEWDDKWVYDFERGEMTSPADIDPFCAQ